jgi:hypothetical protein
MEQSVFVLLLGVVLGCVVASGIWAVLWTLIKGDKRLQKDRIDIMRNIAVLCAEIDGMLTGRMNGGAAFPDFQSSLLPLLEKIRRNLTVSMPLLDVYYVKYIESLIVRYEQALAKGSGAEKAATVAEKASTAAEEDAAVPRAYQAPGEDSHQVAATAANFDVTQQYDLAKEKPGPEALDKRVVVMTRPVEAAPVPAPVAKGRTIKKEPVAPVAVEAGKPTADFSDEIAIQFKRTSSDALKSQTRVVPDEKPVLKEPPQEDAGEANIEDMIKTQRIDLKEEKVQTAKQQPQDENFISGEDVIDKLDSFFGFDNK